MNSETHKSAIAVIEQFGGTAQVARLCEIKSSAVSQWKTNGIPRAWRKYLDLLATVQSAVGPSDSRG